MGGIEFNKIFAAILIAGITAMFAGFIAEQFVHADKLKENAFKIEGVEAAGVSSAVAMPEPILAMIGAADIARGQKLSKACAACHSFEAGGANGVGPNMYDIVGRKKQNVDGYSYSGVLNQNGEEVWTYAALNKFLWKPKTYAPGTKMNYIGLKKPEDRAAMIAWLRTMAPSEKPLPNASAIAAEEAELALPELEAEAVEEAVDTLSDNKIIDADKAAEAADLIKETVDRAQE